MSNVFKSIFWQRIGQRYRYLIRKSNTNKFVFSMQIEKPLSEGGLEIAIFDSPEIQRMLLQIQKEGLIQITPNSQFQLTFNGINYCKRLPETFG